MKSFKEDRLNTCHFPFMLYPCHENEDWMMTEERHGLYFSFFSAQGSWLFSNSAFTGVHCFQTSRRQTLPLHFSRSYRQKNISCNMVTISNFNAFLEICIYICNCNILLTHPAWRCCQPIVTYRSWTLISHFFCCRLK